MAVSKFQMHKRSRLGPDEDDDVEKTETGTEKFKLTHLAFEFCL